MSVTRNPDRTRPGPIHEVLHMRSGAVWIVTGGGYDLFARFTSIDEADRWLHDALEHLHHDCTRHTQNEPQDAA